MNECFVVPDGRNSLVQFLFDGTTKHAEKKHQAELHQ
jgi:hypothetical protein